MGVSGDFEKEEKKEERKKDEENANIPPYKVNQE